jgi:hypothetical protein
VVVVVAGHWVHSLDGDKSQKKKQKTHLFFFLFPYQVWWAQTWWARLSVACMGGGWVTMVVVVVIIVWVRAWGEGA